MKVIKYCDDYKMFILKEYLEYLKININKNVTSEIKKLFNKINNDYKLNLHGFYDVLIYINNDYGIIIEMNKENDEYIKVFDNKLDMKITFKFDSEFYYHNEDGKYLYNDKLYSKTINYESDIIYGNDINKLRKL